MFWRVAGLSTTSPVSLPSALIREFHPRRRERGGIRVVGWGGSSLQDNEHLLQGVCVVGE